MLFYESILWEFQKKKVKYVLVGGIAFNLLGGGRATLDMDILAEMSGENLLKIVKIMKSRGYFIKQPVNPEDIADDNIRRSWIKNKHMKAFNFYKGERRFEEVDIIIDTPVSFKEAIKNAKVIKVKNLNLPVISIDNLIKMKKATKRDKDKVDIKELLRIKEFKNEQKR